MVGSVLGRLCDVCLKGPKDGLQIFPRGAYKNRIVYRCHAHLNTQIEPPIDIEVTIISINENEKSKEIQ